MVQNSYVIKLFAKALRSASYFLVCNKTRQRHALQFDQSKSRNARHSKVYCMTFIIIFCLATLCNGNRTQWRRIHGVIARVISNQTSAQREADLKLRARLPLNCTTRQSYYQFIVPTTTENTCEKLFNSMVEKGLSNLRKTYLNESHEPVNFVLV